MYTGSGWVHRSPEQLVIDHPERVRKLVLDSVTYDIRIPETKLLYILIVTEGINPNQTEGVHRSFQANLNWSGSWDHLSGINKTVMLVVGTAGMQLTRRMLRSRLPGRSTGSWLVRFQGLPHFGSKYAPVQYGQTHSISSA